MCNMKKIILSIFLLMTTLGFSQNYNGTYKDDKTGFVLKISNHNASKGTLIFEIVVDNYPCIGSRKETASCCEYDEALSNEFIFQTGQDDGAEFLYLTFNSNGSVSLKPSDEEFAQFQIVGNCSIWEPTVYNKVVPKKKAVKKAPAKR